MIYPNALQKGDKIRCISPCAFTEHSLVMDFVHLLQEADFEVSLGKYTVHPVPQNYFSATDEERIADFQQAINDPDIKAIWCLRGGYGASRIVDKVDFSPLMSTPKWIIGFSDITLFQLHLYSVHGLCSLHGGMAMISRNRSMGDLTRTLDIMTKKYSSITASNSPSHTHQRTGRTKGKLVGGNLSLISHALGTTSEPHWEDTILFVEDVGEYWYALERMLIQIKRRGIFNKIRGLVLGKFSEMKDTTIPFDKDLYAMIYDLVDNKALPIGFDFPFGHDRDIFPFVQGCLSELNVNQNQSQLTLYLDDF